MAGIVDIVDIVGIGGRAAARRPVVVVAPVDTAVRMGAVGTPLRIERCLDLADCATEADKHLGEDVVRLEAQEPLAELHWNMPVAEMVGGADELKGVAGAHLEQRFGSGNDLDDAPVAASQAVALAQYGAGRKDVAHFLAAGQSHSLPALAAGVVRQHQVLGGWRLAISKGFGKEHFQKRK